MALFFDVAWFDHRLAARGLDRSALAAAGGLSIEALSDVMKDQREVSPVEVAAFAALLGVEPAEIARRCGVTTRTAAPPKDDGLPSRIAALEGRVAALEAQLDLIRRRNEA